MKVMLVAGARPNFMKIASIADAIREHNAAGLTPLAPFVVHTGQHYDERMSAVFFRDLGLPRPDVDLGVGSGSHAAQTAAILAAFEPVLLRERPDALVVVGDVNSSIACSLAAAKAIYPEPAAATGRLRPLLAHVEAGLRSFDRSMPEEVNRVLTDAISDVLFITEASAAENLRREGVSAERVHLVGNTMADTLLRHRERAARSPILARLGLGGGGGRGAGGGGPSRYAVLTLHRPSNVDRAATFEEIAAALAAIARELPVLFPVHPRTRRRITELGLEGRFRLDADGGGCDRPGIHCLEPLGYLDFLALLSSAALVLTDSGGIQEETTVLGVPCVTLRENTERPATVESGTNVIAGTRTEDIVRLARAALASPPAGRTPPLWDGRAGRRIVEILVRLLARPGA
jgi:UDP-N-acetylglucosamine 2-epimerase (non-hydrolysing)